AGGQPGQELPPVHGSASTVGGSGRAARAAVAAATPAAVAPAASARGTPRPVAGSRPEGEAATGAASSTGAGGTAGATGTAAGGASGSARRPRRPAGSSLFVPAGERHDGPSTMPDSGSVRSTTWNQS